MTTEEMKELEETIAFATIHKNIIALKTAYKIQKYVAQLQKENESLKDDLLEMAEALVLESHNRDYCNNCDAWGNHKQDCIVLKAEQIIKESK